MINVMKEDSILPCEASCPRFKVGDKVSRKIDVFDQGSEWRTGEVIKIYAVVMHNSGILYPELYDVQWENGEVGKRFLPHGIKKLETTRKAL